MAGVDAHAHARLVLHLVDDGGDVVETEPYVGALPGGVFNHSGDASRLVKGNVDAFGDAVKALLEGDLLEMAAGMEVEHRESQLLAALHLVQKRAPRFFQRLRLGLSQVDEVAVVRQDMVGGDAHLLTVGLEGLYGLGCEGRRYPLPLVLGEKGKRRGADAGGIQRGVFHTSCGTDVRSDIFHRVVYSIINNEGYWML